MSDCKILLDTNVWVDYFINRSSLNELALELITKAHALDSLTLCTAITSTNNVYYAVRQFLKQEARCEEGDVSEAAALAANEVAWACLGTLRKLSFIVPAAENDMFEANILRDAHSDYEDNLVAAAAKRADAEFVVTSDEQMLAHQPYRCVSIKEALEIIGKATVEHGEGARRG